MARCRPSHARSRNNMARHQAPIADRPAEPCIACAPQPSSSTRFCHSQGDTMSIADIKAISADSHITEPPNCYVDYIDPRYRDVAPHMVEDKRGGESGDVFLVQGYADPLALGLVAAAGKD